MVYSHLITRAVQGAVSGRVQMNGTTDKDAEKANPLAILLFAVTLIVASLALVLFDYTFQVVKILTIIEDIPNDYDLAPATDADDDASNNDNTPKGFRGLYLGGSPNSSDKYITSSFRGTLKYLREEAGFFSAWRGFSVNVAYVVAASVINGMIRVILPFPGGKYLAGLLVLMIVSPLSLIHTHVILAPPTKETWFGRLARTPYKSIIQTLPAMLLLAITGQATYAFPTLLLNAWMPQRSFDDLPTHSGTVYQDMLTPLQCLALYSVFLASHILLFIPSMIILFRVQASVYPASEESIIPYERNGPLSVVQAWKTYTWEGKRRLIRLYAKILPMVWVISLATGTLIFFEMRWVLGSKSPIMESILKVWLQNQTGRAQ